MSAVSGWTFTVNEETVFPIKIKDTFYAVPVKQGPATIHASFLPPGFKTGLTISLVTLATLIIIGVIYVIGKKRREKHTEF